MKHTPATPLPVIELGAPVEGGIFISENDCGRVIGMIRRYSDAEQIVARCNNYSLVVTSLRLLAALADLILKGELAELVEQRSGARALLRELGEL